VPRPSDLRRLDPRAPLETCDDGNTIAGIRKVIFVTSATYTGKLGGLQGADNTCQKLAAAAGLANPATFRAWLSDGFEPIAERITPFQGPYIRPDGVRIADDWEDLTDGVLDTSISIDESKQSHKDDDITYVWTNIAADGGLDSYTSCDGWASADAGKSGRVGVLNSTGSTWTHHSERICLFKARLYCVED